MVFRGVLWASCDLTLLEKKLALLRGVQASISNDQNWSWRRLASGELSGPASDTQAGSSSMREGVLNSVRTTSSRTFRAFKGVPGSFQEWISLPAYRGKLLHFLAQQKLHLFNNIILIPQRLQSARLPLNFPPLSSFFN